MPGATLLPTLIERVANREPEDMEVVLNEKVGPDGDTVAFRLTGPVKPLIRLTLITVEPEPPPSIVRTGELAERTKSGVVNVMVSEVK